MTGQRIQQEAVCFQWFKQQLILSVFEPSISQRSQIKEDTVEPSMPVGEFNLKAYAAITWHNNPANPVLEPRLAATLPIAPPGHPSSLWFYQIIFFNIITVLHCINQQSSLKMQQTQIRCTMHFRHRSSWLVFAFFALVFSIPVLAFSSSPSVCGVEKMACSWNQV